MSDVLEQLIGMSQSLGDPANDYVILGEGNTSVRADEDSFWVKASGTELVRASRDSFVRVRFAPILEAMDGAQLTDTEVKQLLKTVTVEGTRAPSIETFLARPVPATGGHPVRRAYASGGRRFAAVQPAQPRVVLRIVVPRSDRVARSGVCLCPVHGPGPALGFDRPRSASDNSSTLSNASPKY